MRKLSTIFIFCCLLACNTQRKSLQLVPVQLFNKQNLNGWVVKIRNHDLGDNFGNTFRVEDSLLKVRYDAYENFDDKFGHLFYEIPYSAYLLTVEYRFTGQQVKGGAGWALRNSGVMFHGQDPATMAKDQDFPVSIEAQFLGSNGQQSRPTNNLCTPGTHVMMGDTLFTPHCINSSSQTFTDGEWVVARLLVLGDSLITHIVNNDTVLRYTKPQYDGTDQWVQHASLPAGATISGGTISLQSESAPVDFRKVELINLEKFIHDRKTMQTVLNRLQQQQ